MFRFAESFPPTSFLADASFSLLAFSSAQHRLGRTIKQNYLLSCPAKLIRAVRLLTVPHFLTIPRPKPCNRSRV